MMLRLQSRAGRALYSAASFSGSSQAASTAPATTTAAGSEYPILFAEIRTNKNYGSSKVRRLRDTGRIPGVIYGVDEDQNVFKIMVAIDEKVVTTQMRERGRALESTIYELHLKETAVEEAESPVDATTNSSSSSSSSSSSTSSSSGSPTPGAAESSRITKHLVTPRQLQVNPVTDRPMSLNFIKYWPGTRMRIPIEFVNADQCVDLRRGSFLLRVNKFVECICGMEIPKSLVLDLAGAQKGDVLRLSRVVFPPNVKPSRHVPPDYVIAVIRSARGS